MPEPSKTQAKNPPACKSPANCGIKRKKADAGASAFGVKWWAAAFRYCPQRLPQQETNQRGFSLEKMDSCGIGEAECEALTTDSNLRGLVQRWSTLDNVTKGIIETIIQNRPSTP